LTAANGPARDRECSESKVRGGGDGEIGGETNRRAASALFLWERGASAFHRYAIAAYPTQ
jgi:hypothetical protein